MIRILIALFLLLPSTVPAAEVRLGADLLTQFRTNDDDQRELPFNGYFGAGYQSTDRRLSGESSLRIFRDFERSLDDFDLYETVLHARPMETLSVDFGRQFLNTGFFVPLLDGIQTRITPPAPLEISLYSGIPRTVERGDFNKNDGLLSGLRLAGRDLGNLKISLGGSWLKQDWGDANLGRNDEIRIGTSASYLFPGRMAPLLYNLVEYETATRTLETATLGCDFNPASFAMMTVEGNYFNANRELSRPSILASLARGELVTGRLSSTWTILSNILDVYESYAFQRMEVAPSDRRLGHLLESGFLVSFDELELHLQPAYYFSKSFGGDLHGGRIFLEKTFGKASTEAGVDFATYDKITGDNDNAFSGTARLTYEVLKDLDLSAGFEYNRNNIFERDVRGTLRIRYGFSHQI